MSDEDALISPTPLEMLNADLVASEREFQSTSRSVNRMEVQIARLESDLLAARKAQAMARIRLIRTRKAFQTLVAGWDANSADVDVDDEIIEGEVIVNEKDDTEY